MHMHYGIPYCLHKIVIIIMKICKFKIPNLKSVHRMYFTYRYEGTLVVNIIASYVLIKLVKTPWLNGRSNEVMLHSVCICT